MLNLAKTMEQFLASLEDVLGEHILLAVDIQKWETFLS
jgi:hypothetical protein